jgi:MoxR-like ATPase
MNEQLLQQLFVKLRDLETEISKKIIGQKEVVHQILITLLAKGHGLLEGVPGLAKTLLIKTLSEALALKFRRIQFTPDLMPADILGTELLEENLETGKKHFRFQEGAIFANIVLADEINRTPPKTQSALLEAMQEYAVTYSGKTYLLEKPFFILATQNPIEQSGTYPLPEAQLDRFLLSIKMDYPFENEEFMVLQQTTSSQTIQIQKIMGAEDILALQELTKQVFISNELLSSINKMVRSTRPQITEISNIKNFVRWGAGVRAGQAWVLASKANALLSGRYSVVKEDIRSVALPVLRHRILMNFKAESEHISSENIIEILLKGF